MIEPAPDHAFDRVGKLQFAERRPGRHRPAPRVDADHATVAQRAGQLLGEERIALRLSPARARPPPSGVLRRRAAAPRVPQCPAAAMVPSRTIACGVCRSASQSGGRGSSGREAMTISSAGTSRHTRRASAHETESIQCASSSVSTRPPARAVTAASNAATSVWVFSERTSPVIAVVNSLSVTSIGRMPFSRGSQRAIRPVVQRGLEPGAEGRPIRRRRA